MSAAHANAGFAKINRGAMIAVFALTPFVGRGHHAVRQFVVTYTNGTNVIQECAVDRGSGNARSAGTSFGPVTDYAIITIGVDYAGNTFSGGFAATLAGIATVPYAGGIAFVNVIALTCCHITDVVGAGQSVVASRSLGDMPAGAGYCA